MSSLGRTHENPGSNHRHKVSAQHRAARKHETADIAAYEAQLRDVQKRMSPNDKQTEPSGCKTTRAILQHIITIRECQHHYSHSFLILQQPTVTMFARHIAKSLPKPGTKPVRESPHWAQKWVQQPAEGHVCATKATQGTAKGLFQSRAPNLSGKAHTGHRNGSNRNNSVPKAGTKPVRKSPCRAQKWVKQEKVCSKGGHQTCQ